MSDPGKWFSAQRNKNGKIVLVETIEDPPVDSTIMEQESPTANFETNNENLTTPSVTVETPSTKVKCTLRLEFMIHSSVVRPNLLPALNDILEETMATNASIALWQTNKSEKMTAFRPISSDSEFDKYFLNFNDTAGVEKNCYTLLFNIEWNKGSSVSELTRNNTLVQKLKRNNAYFKEHRLAVGAAGVIGEIYLIDPQSINLTEFEKEYNRKLYEFLKSKQEDHRFKRYNINDKVNIVEFGMKHTKLKMKQKDIIKVVDLRTIEVKCKRRTSRVVNAMITEANLNSDHFGVYLQSEHKRKNTEVFNKFAIFHNEITSKSARIILNEISPQLMSTQITDEKESSLMDTLFALETLEGDEVFSSIVNLSPNVNSWILNTTEENKLIASDLLRQIMKKFVTTELYTSTLGQNHTAEEHIYVPRSINSTSNLPMVPEQEDTSVQVISQRSSGRRVVASAVPSVVSNRISGNATWSSIVSGGSPTGSTASVRSDISIIQEQNDLLNKKVEEMTQQYNQLRELIQTQQNQLKEQEQRHMEQNEKRKEEQEKRENERKLYDEEKDRKHAAQIQEMMDLNRRLADQNSSISEQLNMCIISSKTNSELVELAVNQMKQSQIEQKETGERTRRELTEFVSQMASVQRAPRGEKRTSESLEDNNKDTDSTMNLDTPQPSDTFQPRYTENSTPHHNLTPMEYTPKPTIGPTIQLSSLAMATNNSSLAHRQETSTPLRANSLINQEDEDNDFPDYDECIHDDHPADPPDLAGQRL